VIGFLVLLCGFGSTYQPASQATVAALYGSEIRPYWSYQSANRFTPAFDVRDWQIIQAQTQGEWVKAVNDCVAAHNPPLASGYIIQGSQNLLDYSVALPDMPLLIQGQPVRLPVAVMRSTDIINPASIAHEMGHMLWLGHTNNNDGDTDTYDNPWDLMSGAFTYAVQYGRTWTWKPKSLAAVHRHQLGWIDHVTTLTEGTHRVGLMPVGVYGTQLIQAGEYSLEAKRRYGGDAALPDEGVVVYKGVLLQDITDYSSGSDSVLTPGETGVYGNVTITVHSLYDLTVTVSNNLFNSGFEESQ
jgi:hypothetical protein